MITFCGPPAVCIITRVVVQVCVLHVCETLNLWVGLWWSQVCDKIFNLGTEIILQSKEKLQVEQQSGHCSVIMAVGLTVVLLGCSRAYRICDK